MSFHLFPGRDSLVYALLHTLRQGGLIVLLLSVLLHFVSVRRAQVRYLLSVLALASVLFAGICTWAWLDVSIRRTPSPTSVAAFASFPLPPSGREKVLGNSSPEARSSHSFPLQGEPLRAPSISGHWIPWLAAFWACGVAVFLIRSIIAILGAEQLCRQAREVRDPEVLAMADSIRTALGIGRRIRLLVAEQVNMPAVIGMIQPAVLLPASLVMGLPQEYLRAVLHHEFAHIRRWDYLVNIGQMLLEALLFFNPFVWWISRQVRCEREACCDLIAAVHCQSPDLYLKAVLACAEHASRSQREEEADELPSTALAMGGSNGDRHKSLLDRAKRLLFPGYKSSIRVPWLTLAGILVITGLILFAAGKGAFWAAKVLTPRERIQHIEKLQKEYATEPIKKGNIEISGSVMTEDGQPLPADGQIIVHSQNQNSGLTSANCLRDGKFTLSVPAGIVDVAAYVKGYAPAYINGLRGDKDLKDLRLVVKKGFPATIHIVDTEGKPLEAVQVEGRYGGQPTVGYFKLSTNANGDAQIGAVGSDSMEFEASKAGFQNDRQKEIHFKPDEPWQWVLHPASLLKGRVVSEETGAPVPDARVELLDISGPNRNGFSPDSAPLLATANKRGEFTLDTLRSDSTYSLQFKADGFRPTVHYGVTIQNSPLEIKLSSPLHINGKVILPKSDAQAGTVDVRCEQSVRTAPDSSYGTRQIQKVQVRDGVASFAFSGLYSAETSVSASVNSRNVRLPHFSQSVDDLTLDLSAPEDSSKADSKRWVVIRFDIPKGAPAPAGSIEVIENGIHNREYRRRAESINNGEVWLELAAPNELELNPNGLIGYYFSPRTRQKIDESSSPFEIRLPVIPAGSIYGEITEADGSPAKGVFINVLETNPTTESRMSTLSLSNQVGAQDITNSFVATPLPLGKTYAVLVWRGSTFAMSPSVRVDEKNPIPKTRVIIPKGITVTGRVIDEEGHPVPPMRFDFGYTTPSGHGFGSNGNIEGAGMFSIPHVNFDVPGTYQIRLKPTAEYISKEVILDRGHPNPTVVLRKGKVITGLAIDATTGLPMPGLEIYVLSEKPIALEPGAKPEYFSGDAEARTDNQGRFRFSNLPAGMFRLNSRNANLADPYDHTVVASGHQEPVTLKLKPIPSR